MIVDDIRNLEMYPQFGSCLEAIRAFIEKDRKEKLPDGKYPLIGSDRLFALVQEYETKPFAEGRMESHHLYADLQYITDGREFIYYDLTENLVPDGKPTEGDILFYEKGKNRGGNLISAGMFGYYAPWDAHMSCIEAEEGRREKGRKIVFKIKM